MIIWKWGLCLTLDGKREETRPHSPCMLVKKPEEKDTGFSDFSRRPDVT